ncbi:Ig-like domain-containing protein [Pendulispora rubella]|uniref:Ig-like domain-containing protein n=1 Tax=Pendulispora rubella TaxID=2741070 RepID=A0ABZ2KRL4_9BACT
MIAAKRSPSFSWLLAVLTCMATGAFWACSSSDGSPVSTGGVLGPADASPQEPSDASPPDAGSDTSVEPQELTVVSLAPTSGDTNVFVEDPIQVTFSEPVQIGASAVTLTTPDGTTIPTTIKRSADERTLTLSPVAPQKAPAEVVAHFNAVSTLDGRPLTSAPNWSWKLPPWLRVSPDPRKSDFSVHDGSMVIGPGRETILASGGESTPGGNWTGSVYSFGTPHGPWTRLGGRPLSKVMWSPRVVLDPSGNIVVASLYDKQIFVQRWSGTGWNFLGEPIPDANDIVRTLMAIDARGKLFVGASQTVHGEPDTYNLVVRSFDGNGTWSSVGGTVNDVRTSQTFDPYLALDPAGVPYVAYTDPWANVRKWTGAAWVPVGSNLAPTGGYARWLAIAFDDGGRLFALGGFSDETTRVIMFNGSNWVPVGEALGGTVAASLVAGRDGHLFGAIYEGNFGDSFRVVDITQAGWTKIDWPIPGVAGALAVGPDNIPVVASSRAGVLRLHR